MPTRPSKTYKTNGNQAYSAGKKNYTRSVTGRMSVDGRTAGGSTQGFTDKDRGKVSAKGQLLTRRQRYYQVRVGLGLSGG